MAETTAPGKTFTRQWKFRTVITITGYRYTLYRGVAQYQYKKYRFFSADMSLPVGARMAAAPQA
ncbi:MULTISPECIES: hypothetical protein [unclassified Pseudomonas]|uniref:hypothetical protein n=1 Tax=unclassified Pseudomonas TaxID=196821 RepID=UPI0015AC1687|nr:MULTISPECIES: hypothetical protein [unclassified Pseudomonas]